MEQRKKCKGKLGRFPAGQGHGLIGVCGKYLAGYCGESGWKMGRGRQGGGSCSVRQLWVLWPFPALVWP